MGWVIQGEIAKLNQGLTHVEKFVLLAFSSFALDDGSSCYPALATVAERTILSERTVRRVVAKLVKNGVMIAKGKHGNRSTRNFCYWSSRFALMTRAAFRGGPLVTWR